LQQTDLEENEKRVNDGAVRSRPSDDAESFLESGTAAGYISEDTVMSPQETEVLVVEDDPDETELTRLALAKCAQNARVVFVKDGAQAIDFIFSSGARAPATPRLILLDVNLPKADGFDVLRALRADPRTRDVPVVMLTSSDQDEDVSRSYALGANSYIVKPADFDEYIAVVADAGTYWLRRNRPAV
jgi:two-component system response regulator